MRTSTRTARRVAVIVAVGTALGLGLASSPGTAIAAVTGWRVVFRSASAQSNQIRAVAALSSRDAWAVGATARSGAPGDHPRAPRP